MGSLAWELSRWRQLFYAMPYCSQVKTPFWIQWGYLALYSWIQCVFRYTASKNNAIDFLSWRLKGSQLLYHASSCVLFSQVKIFVSSDCCSMDQVAPFASCISARSTQGIDTECQVDCPQSMTCRCTKQVNVEASNIASYQLLCY